MTDPAEFLVIAWLAAIAGGITSSLLGASTDPTKQFDIRKFGGAIATGIVVGLVFGITDASVNPVFKDPKATLFDITYQIGLVYVGAVGADHIRNRVGDLVTNRADNPQANDKQVSVKANAGPDQTVSRGSTVTLDGTGSVSTSGATLVSYSWVQISGTSVTLPPNTNTAKLVFTAPQQPTTLSFVLTVKDSSGADSTPSTVSVTVT